MYSVKFMNAANYPQLSHHKLDQPKGMFLGHSGQVPIPSTIFLGFCFGHLLLWVLILEHVRGDGILSPAPQWFPQLLEYKGMWETSTRAAVY